MTQAVSESLRHLSERPWSDYTKADYSIEQWHSACLIHIHQGAPTSKDQCKLPVKTPNGALNRNGVHAAAAALAGARTPLNAPPDQKAKAARALRGYYNQMNEKPPPSLMKHSDISDFIEHHGVKGMRWGVRRTRERVAARRAAGKTAVEDFSKTKHIRGKPVHQLTNEELKRVNERMNLEQNYKRLNPSTIKKGQLAAAGIISTAGMVFTVYNMYHSKLGQDLLKLGKGWMGHSGHGQLKFPGM